MGKTTNQKIQNQLSKAGNNVNYLEAAAVASKIGVSVDRVLNNTAKTGQNVKIGAAAVNAGYTGQDSKVASSVNYSSGYQKAYFDQQVGNIQSGYDQQIADLTNQLANPQGAFDWDAWTNEMNTRQQAIWDSMDQMNAEFMNQQNAFLESQRQAAAAQGGSIAGSRGTVFGGSGASDPAQVKRKKKATQTSAATTTSTAAAGSSNNGLSIGGPGNGQGLGLALGKNK